MNLERVFYVNLDYREDRKYNMETSLPLLGAEVIRYAAIRPSRADITEGIYRSYYARTVPRIKGYLKHEDTYGRAFGIYGVYLSQLNIHKSQIGSSGLYAIVEDDAVISPATAKKLDRILSSDLLPNDWDMLRHIWSDDNDQSGDISRFSSAHKESRFANQYSHGRFGGAHFSICKGSSAEKIVEYMEKDFVYAVDSVYSTHMLNVYHTNLNVRIGDFGTDIPKTELERPRDPQKPQCYVP